MSPNPTPAASTPLATIADVELCWRPLVDAEQGQARHALVLASALARRDAPGLDGRIAAGELDADLVAHVVAGVVARVMRNPDGARQRSETVGPFTTSSSYADTVSQLALQPGELRLLAAPRSPVAGLGTIRLDPGLAPGRPAPRSLF